MSVTTVFTDVESAVRSWLRGQITGVGAEVHLAIPKTATYPLIHVNRVGGGPQFGETPLDDALLSFDVWANTKFEAMNATRALVSLLMESSAFTLADGVWCGGFVVGSVVFAPDREAKKSRYSVTATATVMAR